MVHTNPLRLLIPDSLYLPIQTATFQQPHSTNILQKANCAFYATFIRKVQSLCFSSDYRCICFNPHQRPSSATQICEITINAGTAATAEPVSCPATAITGIAPNPVIFCTSSVNVPIFSPGKFFSQNDRNSLLHSLGSPNCFQQPSGSRRCVCAFTNWAVEAMVYSVTIFPVSELYNSTHPA